MNQQTPAVTKVEECTKAETGVGAAIAAGNQEEKVDSTAEQCDTHTPIRT